MKEAYTWRCECVDGPETQDDTRLIPAENSSLFPDEEQCPYFPGLVVHAASSVLRAAKWTRGSYRGAGRGAGVVARIAPGDITVAGVACCKLSSSPVTV